MDRFTKVLLPSMPNNLFKVILGPELRCYDFYTASTLQNLTQT